MNGDADKTALLEDIKADDDAMISYTSGTTGSPKGVVLKNNDIVKISLYSTKLWSDENDKPFSIAAPEHFAGAAGFVAGVEGDGRVGAADILPVDHRRQIGRASCRERV